MRKVFNLLFGVLFATVVFCENAQASKMECAYSLPNLNVEPILHTNAHRTFTVNISCKIQCTHKGKPTPSIDHDESLNPVVVPDFGEEDENMEKRKRIIAAYQRGVDRANMRGVFRLLEDCSKMDLISKSPCDCKETGCNCIACNPPKDNSRPASEEEKAVDAKQKNGLENTILNPIKLTKIKKINEISNVQQNYIDKNYKGYSVCGNMYTMRDGLYIHIVSIINEEGQRNFVYFDMTDVYKKLKSSRGKEAKMRIKELMESHMPLKDEAKK